MNLFIQIGKKIIQNVTNLPKECPNSFDPHFRFKLHTSYLSFFLHKQDFRKPNFTPQKTTKDTKNTKNVSEKVKCMQFFLTQSGKNYT